MKAIDLSASYQCADNKVVVLSVVIGDAQIGSSVVFLGDEEVASGDIKDCKVGKGTAVNGKELGIKTVVTDVNDKTNQMSVTYKLTGGQSAQTFVSKGTVETNGDSLIFRAIFNLMV